MKVTVRHFRCPRIENNVYKKGKPGVVLPYRRGIGFVNPFYNHEKPSERGGETHYTMHFDTGLNIRGIATCSLSDQFSYKKGYQIAKGRAEKACQEYLKNQS